MAKSTTKTYKPYYKKAKWSSNIRNINDVIGDSSPIPATDTFSQALQLLLNPIQSYNTVSQIYTVKNVEMQIALQAGQSENFDNITIYIMYLPQGVTPGNDYELIHPEYIMAYRFIDQPNDKDIQYSNPITVKSRLSRKLNTGDSIIMYIKGYHSANNNTDQLGVKGICRWWTKAN